MTCSHCGASWTLPAGRPAPQNCPFCRRPLGPAWRQVHTPQEGFAWALELMGKEGLRESSRVLGLFADAGPELEGQLQLVRIFFASGSHLALLDALGRDAAAQTLARSRSLNTLTATYYLAEPAARYICDSFWFAITGSGTAVLNAARPAAPVQKAQPPHYPSLSLAECTRLALADDPAAIKELAHRYELGRGGAPQNPTEALHWWRRAAE
ncbi:MAG: sel1 repeat family protein, partial [Oscillospiraceae bacterium]|nr:sel1 repeat family protein [Oscillospiraceae bacterium]